MPCYFFFTTVVYADDHKKKYYDKDGKKYPKKMWDKKGKKMWNKKGKHGGAFTMIEAQGTLFLYNKRTGEVLGMQRLQKNLRTGNG